MKELNLITSLRSCMLISTLVYLMTIIIFVNSVVGDDNYKEIIEDLPTALDFDRYLSALEMAVEFCIRHKHYVDLNLQFGLVLIDVNLRQVLQQKGTSVPTNTRSRLEELFGKNDEVNNYFHQMAQKNKNVPMLGQTLKLSRQYYNATEWTKPVDKFNLDLLNQTTIYSPELLKKIYGTWKKYYNNVNNFATNRPTPIESNECVAYMVWAPSLPLNRRSQSNCLTTPRCKEFLQKGSDYGYGLTHRLLYMVVARFSRRCVVFSEKEDISMTDMHCKKSFGEAQFIASNSFQLPDLLYEQIAFCSIFGHAQFIRNYWFKTLLDFQVSEGCFSEKVVSRDFNESRMREDEDETWIMERQKPYIMNGQCKGHFTAVAVAALSHALRYIIETYY